jgi:hypothetical protein
MGMVQTEQTFARSVSLHAAPAVVWDALLDPHALSWMVVGCSFTAAVPKLSESDAELRCWWTRCDYRALGSGVFEIEELEPRRRLTFRELARRAMQFEFTLEPDAAGCRVEIVGIGKGWDSAGAVRKLVKRWVHRLPKAIRASATAEPPSPGRVIDGAGPRPLAAVQSIEVSAPLDVIWAAVDDPNGSIVHSPRVIRQWRAQIAETEYSFSIMEPKGPRTVCSVSEVIRHADHHVTTRGAFWEIEHHLEAQGTGGRLFATYRWSRHLRVTRAAMENDLNDWMSSVKVAAEAH